MFQTAGIETNLCGVSTKQKLYCIICILSLSAVSENIEARFKNITEERDELKTLIDFGKCEGETTLKYSTLLHFLHIFPL